MAGPIILTYHSVNDRGCLGIYPDNIVSVDTFELQMRYLSQKKRILRLMELVECLRRGQEPPRDGVVITFDDSYRDFYSKAYPILRRYGAPSTLFIVTGFLDSGAQKWDDELAYLVNSTSLSALVVGIRGEGRTYPLDSQRLRRDCILDLAKTLHTLSEEEKTGILSEIRTQTHQTILDRQQRVTLTWREVVELSRGEDDLVSFGAHSHSHSNLVSIPLGMAEREIAMSKQQIESRLGMPCVLFSYPFGVFSEQIKELLRSQHFTAATTTIARRISLGDDVFELGRVCAIDDSLSAFTQLLDRAQGD